MGKKKPKPPTNLPKIASATGVDVSAVDETSLHVNVTAEDAIKRLFGTDHEALAETLLLQCLSSLSTSETSSSNPQKNGLQFLLEVVAEFEPRDGIERMLAVQMATTHVHMMRAGRKMANATMLPQLEAQLRAHTKLARSFTAQMEALRKHRNGGKQVVQVQHVNVEDGGQAIVGHVQAGGANRER